MSTMDNEDQTIKRLAAELTEHERALAEHDARGAPLRENVAALKRVIALLSGGKHVRRTEAVDAAPAERPIRDFRDHQLQPSPPLTMARPQETQLDWLVRYAQENNGLVAVRDVKPQFIAAGLTRSKARNVSSHLYHTLGRSSLFERVGPGEFRLIGDQPEAEPEADATDELSPPISLFDGQPGDR